MQAGLKLWDRARGIAQQKVHQSCVVLELNQRGFVMKMWKQNWCSMFNVPCFSLLCTLLFLLHHCSSHMKQNRISSVQRSKTALSSVKCFLLPAALAFQQGGQLSQQWDDEFWGQHQWHLFLTNQKKLQPNKIHIAGTASSSHCWCKQQHKTI